MMADELPDDPVALKKKIATLESELEKKKKTSFWAITGWQDAVKVISIPIALILALVTFWDTVVLRVIGRDAASVAQVAANIEALQSMDQKLYMLEAQDNGAGARAAEAAIIARRERVVAETFDHWRRHPSYFRPAELQILTHHLIVQNRTDDALKVYESYWPSLRTPFAQAGGKLLEARIYAREGPVQSLDRAKERLKEAFKLSEGISNSVDRVEMQGQLVYMRGIIAFDREEDCSSAGPFVTALETLAEDDPSGVLAGSAADMRTRFNATCGG